MSCHPFRAIALLLMAYLSVACTSKEKAHQRPPAPVSVVAAIAADLPQRLVLAGTVEATESVVLRPQLSGELAEVYFSEGQDVVRGQKLFLIDPRPYQAALKKAEASLARNRVVMENARRDYQRYAQLVRDGIVTQEQAEGYRTKAETAAADLDADRAAVENAKVQLSYCTITAPISGRLGGLMVHRGNVVEATKTSLVTLNRMAPMYVSFGLPERELAAVKAKMATGKLLIDAELQGGSVERGVIGFLDNAVDPATGTIKLKGIFENRSRKLWPGQFVQIGLVLAEYKTVVAVPSQAVQNGQQGTFVLVVKPDMSAELRAVTTGPTHQGLTAILKGLAVGERVVRDGHMRVIPGSKVEIKQDGPQEHQQPRVAR